MNYKESVKMKIIGEADELERRRQLWEQIVDAYQEGGQSAMKSLLVKQGESITAEFAELLKQLRANL